MSESPLHATRSSPALHDDAGGAVLNRQPRRRRDQALLRGRFRTLFFILITVTAVALGHPAAAALALAGVVLGLTSSRVALRRGQDLAYSFAVVDWLVLGCAVGLSGGAGSWLLWSVPVLAAGQLAVSPRHDWPYLLAPTLLLVIVLAIIDPQLGGDKTMALLKLLVLTSGGVAAAYRVTSRRSRPRAARFDPTTGFYAPGRLKDIGAVRIDVSGTESEPLSLVYLRLRHFEDSRSFLGPQGSEALAKGVAERLRSQLGRGDIAFRISADAFAVLLPGRGTPEARAFAADVAGQIESGLIAGRRQALATGVAAFPELATIDALLASAEAAARRPGPDACAVARVVKVAAAR